MGATVGVVVFPGTNCEMDTVDVLEALGGVARTLWHADDDLTGVDAVVVPGGFAHGDYLRPGAIARFSPIMSEVMSFAKKGGPVLGICNGFQILTESGLLPGALIRNRGLKFLCQDVHLTVEGRETPFTTDLSRKRSIRIPIAHMEGNYVADEHTLDRLEGEGQVLFRYSEGAPNGASRNIAGICNSGGNVVGLMPHPERVIEAAVGGTDGQGFFTSLARHLA